MENEFVESIAKGYVYIYAIWCITTYIMDIIVCGNIFYSAPTVSYPLHVQQLYSLPGMEYELSHWLQVYGAISVTKCVVWLSVLVNPFLILIIGTYLQISGNDIDKKYENCNDDGITCQVFNNPVQYPQLGLLNEIELFGSVIVIGLPVVFIIFYLLFRYVLNVITRVNEICCCTCYKRFCQKCSYVFCNGQEPEDLV
jgi:hypothetical protein